MRNRQWMVLFTVAALGVAACGGDANGSDSMSEMNDASQMADNMDGQMGEQMADQGASEMADQGAAAESGASDVTAQELPDGVTMAMVQEGDQIFHGAGICASCHGPKGTGLPNLGANLTDSEWLHSDGSYDAIVNTIMHGVTAEESTSGVPMPPKAGTNITDDQVKAVAAYVWTLSK
ncbi:MAG: c-type cytochrome [Gemmatimonadales bacterium]